MAASAKQRWFILYFAFIGAIGVFCVLVNVIP